MALKELSFEDAVEKIKNSSPARQYYAMYSSWYGGVIRDPQLMMVPVDDHMVHRGDAVFEAMKAVDGKIYGLDRHLERMTRSAEMISLKVPHSLKELHEICVGTVRISKAKDCVLRLFCSRGPGNFTTNPYDTLGSQIYLVITPYKGLAQEKYEKGVSVRVSKIAVKEGFLATVKSCNYLPNVLMKKEAIDWGVDFTVSRDEGGHLAEGSTENFAIVTKDGEFRLPGFERILRGVTAVRAMELARDHLIGGTQLKSVSNAAISIGDVEEAREAFLLGTTLDCLPVTSFEGRPVGNGRVGPVARAVLKLLQEDMKMGPLVTVV